METLEQIIEEFERNKDKFSASYDPVTGKVKRVGPSVSFVDEIHKIDLRVDVAESILTSEVSISNCYVDIASGEFEIVEHKKITKIDDIIHRIPLEEYSTSKKNDIYITVDRQKKTIKFELAKNLGGTKKTSENFERKIHWGGDTVMNFYLTRYNDPHFIYEQFDIKISELIKKSVTYKNIDIGKKFSLFTRRILKNYVLEIK